MKKALIILAIQLLGINLFPIENLTELTWSQAFEIVHACVVEHYPFAVHKQINLDSVYTVTALAVKQAEEANNDTAYYKAMRHYASVFTDNHVFMKRKDFKLHTEHLSGHYGMEICRLDNGEVVICQVRRLKEDCPPELQVGARIITWNGQPVMDAIADVSLLLAERMEATAQNRFLKRCELLMYEKPGNIVSICIQSEDGNRRELNLEARPLEELSEALIYPVQTQWRRAMKSPVQFDVLDDSIGYFQISAFMPNMDDFSLPGTFRDKLWVLKQLDISSLIIDLRGNQGGVDDWAVKMAGHFVKEPRHYQYIEKYSKASEGFELDSAMTSVVQPRKPYFDQEVVILVDHRTVSTGEGLPMVLQDLSNVKVAGQYGTAGAFATGFSEYIFKMPTGVVFGFFEGRSLDVNGEIQLDADANGMGGVRPDLEIPVSLESVLSQYAVGEDYALNYVIDYLNQIHLRTSVQ